MYSTYVCIGLAQGLPEDCTHTDGTDDVSSNLFFAVAYSKCTVLNKISCSALQALTVLKHLGGLLLNLFPQLSTIIDLLHYSVTDQLPSFQVKVHSSCVTGPLHLPASHLTSGNTFHCMCMGTVCTTRAHSDLPNICPSFHSRPSRLRLGCAQYVHTNQQVFIYLVDFGPVQVSIPDSLCG